MNSNLPQKNKYILTDPNPNTIRRLKEIEFYLLINNLFTKVGLDNKEKVKDVLLLMADIADVDGHLTNMIFRTLSMSTFRPTKREMALMCRYRGLSFNEIYSLFSIHPNTVTKYVKEYISEDQPTMMPMLGLEYDPYLTEILDALKKSFASFGLFSEVFLKHENKRKKAIDSERNSESDR